MKLNNTLNLRPANDGCAIMMDLVYDWNDSGAHIMLPASGETERKLRSFESLAPGWHYGVGGGIDHETVTLSSQLLKYLTQLGFSSTDAFPGVDGEVLLTVYRDASYIEIVVYSTDRISIIYERSDAELYRAENVNTKRVLLELKRIAAEIWGSSVSSTPTIMTSAEGALQVWPLKRPKMAEHQSSWLNVLRIAEAPSVFISGPITSRAWPANLPYSGTSIRRSYLWVTA